MAEKTILLVEDNADDVELTLRALELNKILNEVAIARDGEEALNFLFGRGPFSEKGLAQMPAVILLDIKMPKVDGLGVLRQVRANPATRLIPIVMLTSSREERDLIQSYSLGANSYVRKPVDFNEFVSVIQQLGLYWLRINETPPEMAVPPTDT